MNPNCRNKLDEFSYRAGLGYKKMKNSKVAICGLARDCRYKLPLIKVAIDNLSQCFSKSYIVIVENDSKDGTKEFLEKWRTLDSNVHLITEDTGERTIPERTGNVRPGFTCHRIKKMAMHRNKYMDYLHGMNWPLDYIIIVDLDLFNISIDGIANSFGQSLSWDVITSYGIKWIDKQPIYYDTYALQEIGDLRSQTEDSIRTYQNTFSGLEIGSAMVPVASAFSGLAIYKATSIMGHKYFCMQNNDPDVEAICEHVTLHQDMRSKGNGNIYINPSQVVYYAKPELNILKKLKNYFNFDKHNVF